MKDFDLQIRTRLLFGPGKENKFNEHVASLGTRVFLVIGGGSVKRLGYLDRVTRGLEKQGCEILLFEGIEPNPLAGTINRATAQLREFKGEVVLALGGGSAMDAAKAIAGLAVTDDEDIWPYTLGGAKMGRMTNALPIACIPTTAATASEVTPHSVVSNPHVRGKSPLSYPFFQPTVSWLNPEFTLELPPATTRDGASDILSHVFENYLIGGNRSPLADRYSEGIIATVVETLPLVIAEPDNYELRARLLWASNLALNGYQHAGREASGFILHAIEHAISGFYHNIAHGRGLATLYPAYFRWLWQNDRCRDRLAQLGDRIFGIEKDDISYASLAFINRFEEWLQQNELLQSLTDLGVSESDFEAIADYTIATYGFGKPLQARGELNRDNIVEILKMTERVKV